LAIATAQDLSPDTLQDLVYLATDAGETGLAVKAAERLVALRPGNAQAVLLARSLLNAKQAKRALDELRALPAGAAVPDDLHEAVLIAAWRQGAAVADELRAIWRAHLAAATTPSQREAAVAVLLELRAMLTCFRCSVSWRTRTRSTGLRYTARLPLQLGTGRSCPGSGQRQRCGPGCQRISGAS